MSFYIHAGISLTGYSIKTYACNYDCVGPFPTHEAAADYITSEVIKRAKK